MDSIVKIKKNRCFIDSEGIAYLSENEHRAVTKLIRTYKSDLEEFGVLTLVVSKPTSKGGRPKHTWEMNEEQATLLTTFMGNSKKVREFKVKLVEEFYKMKSSLIEMSTNKRNQEWLTNREDGKLQRKSTTDVIHKFVDYAVSQGSGSAKMYYMNISKLENKSLFFVQEKFPNLREVMNNRQLSFIKSADIIVEEAIIEGLEKEMFYKDIYQLCRKRVEAFSDLIPKTNIPMMIKDNK